jgi:nitrite reductase (NADH) small subunit
VSGWARVCSLEALVPGRGVAALVGEEQVALFLLADGSLRAVGHHDPCSGANVIARGLTGSHDGRPTVASPIHKQRFDLVTGRCLDDDRARIPIFAARLIDGWVEVTTGTADRSESGTVLEPHPAPETVG